jgi:hypothetical protein
MPEPEIQTPPDFQFYVQQHGVHAVREFKRDSIEGLQKSLSKAHDNLSKQVGINTRLYAQLTKAERLAERCSTRIWILGGCVIAQFAIIGWLAQELLARLK